MGVVLTYTTYDGSQRRVELQEATTRIMIRGRDVRNIDLAPLEDCTRLQIVDLAWNGIEAIDLGPLRACMDLRSLSMANNRLESIDLAPLRGCTNLQEVHLGWNRLSSVDLTPLSRCTSLQSLRASNNMLEDINLDALRPCTQLEEIAVAMNRLTRIDLEPLSSNEALQTIWLSENQLHDVHFGNTSGWTNLQELDLSGNRLEEIDLTVLMSCSHLKKLYLNSNQIRTLDLTPLSFCTALEEVKFEQDREYTALSWLPLSPTISSIHYERPSPAQTWRLLHHASRCRGYDARLQQEIIYALGLGEYGFIDYDLQNIFASIPLDTDLPIVCNQIRLHLVNRIIDAIDGNRTCTGATIEKLMSRHGEIAARFQDISELRKNEIRNVQVGVSEDNADLRELYLTSYGYDILSALGVKLTTDMDSLSLVIEAFHKLGLELRVGDFTLSGANMSIGLKNAIWWIVENRGRSWTDISA